jgi:hypothetical protein
MYVLITREAKDRHRAREGARREEKGEGERAAALRVEMCGKAGPKSKGEKVACK